MNFNKLLAISFIVSLTSLSFASSENQLENRVDSLEKKIDQLVKLNKECINSNKEMHSLVKGVTGEHMQAINEIVDLSIKEMAEEAQKNIDFLKNEGYVFVESPDGNKHLVNSNELKKTSEFKLYKKFEDQKGKEEFLAAFR